jgi:phage anti-repressor protein
LSKDIKVTTQPGLNSDTVAFMRLNIEAAVTNITIVLNTIDSCSVTETAITHNQSQSLILQLQGAKSVLMAVETNMGRELMDQFIENEQAAVRMMYATGDAK